MKYKSILILTSLFSLIFGAAAHSSAQAADNNQKRPGFVLTKTDIDRVRAKGLLNSQPVNKQLVKSRGLGDSAEDQDVVMFAEIFCSFGDDKNLCCYYGCYNSSCYCSFRFGWLTTPDGNVTPCAVIADMKFNSPLGKKGLQNGDIVTEIDKAKIRINRVEQLKGITVQSDLKVVKGSEARVAKKVYEANRETLASNDRKPSYALNEITGTGTAIDGAGKTLYEYFEKE